MAKVNDTSFYNSASSQKLGWHPDWFGVTGFGRDLEEAVRAFQTENGLEADGLVGPMTYSRIFTKLHADMESGTNFIIADGKYLKINWPKVNVEKYYLPNSNYRTVSGTREINKIVTHWDATLSAEKCYTILKNRGISTHFVIDNDGTIYQMVDTKHRAWHAGGFNKNSIGIDISNAYYTKYNSVYQKMGYNLRPVLRSKLHGSDLGEHLGYYPEQIKAYKALLEVLCDYYNIPLEVPLDRKGKLLLREMDEKEKLDFSGIMCHYHLTSNKIDCAGLELDKIVNEIKEESE
jgi:hypothetical protein